MLKIGRDYLGRYTVKVCGHTYAYKTLASAKRHIPGVEKKWQAQIEAENQEYEKRYNKKYDDLKQQLKQSRKRTMYWNMRLKEETMPCKKKKKPK